MTSALWSYETSQSNIIHSTTGHMDELQSIRYSSHSQSTSERPTITTSSLANALGRRGKQQLLVEMCKERRYK